MIDGDRAVPMIPADEEALRDLSVGEMNIAIRPTPGDTRIVPEQRLRIEIPWGEEVMILDGRARHTRKLANGELRMGVQFRKLDGTIEGRRISAVLTQIVGHFQRYEIRRTRLGLAG